MSRNRQQQGAQRIVDAPTPPSVVETAAQHNVKAGVTTDSHSFTPAPVVPEPTSWRVVKGGTFSMNGSMATVQPGHIVKASVYGRDGLARMLGRGIVLEPIA